MNINDDQQYTQQMQMEYVRHVLSEMDDIIKVDESFKEYHAFYVKKAIDIMDKFISEVEQ